MDDRGGQRRLTVVLFAVFNVDPVVQKPLHPFRTVAVDATVNTSAVAIYFRGGGSFTHTTAYRTAPSHGQAVTDAGANPFAASSTAIAFRSAAVRSR
jgi:hypothetical protein